MALYNYYISFKLIQYQEFTVLYDLVFNVFFIFVSIVYHILADTMENVDAISTRYVSTLMPKGMSILEITLACYSNLFPLHQW